jgi:hypothetical protein
MECGQERSWHNRLRPNVSVRGAELRGFAGQLGHLIRRFNVAVNRVLVVYREPVLDMQLCALGLRAQSLRFRVAAVQVQCETRPQLSAPEHVSA